MGRPEKLCGQTYIKLKNGEEIQAFWRGGRREGWGTILGPRFEQVLRDIKGCTGTQRYQGLIRYTEISRFEQVHGDYKV